jgi:hypothetical protein
MNAAADKAGTVNREEEFTFLFAQLVLQQSNMAMMLLGKVAHPETGKVVQDIDAARLFIDQLEMLETKTKGNLSKEEDALLKQTLMNLRLNFVQTVESPAPPAEKKPTPKEPSSEGSKPAESAASTASVDSSSSQEEEHRKKFSKKY